MTKEEIRSRLQDGTEPSKDELYAMMDALGIAYRRTSCKRCLKDYRAIIMEEVGLMADASEASAFDARYEYLMDRDYSWQGHRLNQETPAWVIRRFMACHKDAGLYYRVVQAADNKENTEEN